MTQIAQPTAYPDLNEVLRELVSSVEAILGENFVGAYLQGSFAVGDADEHSDVDFIVVTHDEVSDERVDELEAMQKRLYELGTPWAQHLEGSYFPKELLRRVDPNRSPLVYFDNGSTVPERDNHCNTAVVRWSLREHGVILAGPEPKSLIEPVQTADLHREVHEAMIEFAEWATSPTKAGGMSRWMQPYLVLNFCRMLQTLQTGVIASKKAGGEWALAALDPEWADLIQQALYDRPDPWRRVYEPADPEVAQRTLAFVDYALSVAPVSPTSHGDDRRGSRVCDHASSKQRGVRARSREAPNRPDRLSVPLARWLDDGLRFPQGMAGRARRIRAREVHAAERPPLQLGSRQSRRHRRGRDA